MKGKKNKIKDELEIDFKFELFENKNDKFQQQYQVKGFHIHNSIRNENQ